jgi:phosphoribosylaminoimidazolecarboxamide formyltransferase/IMP cyclohydrolase
MAKTAFLSVTDKTGIEDFASGLLALGYRLVASGGTLTTLRQADLPVTDVSELTSFPDLCAGRLRLIHPKLFAAITADRDSPDQMRDLEREGIASIDLVAVNLYPLSQVLESRDMDAREVIDFIDVSASALLRAAARNHPHVITLCDPRDYPSVLEALRQGEGLSAERARSLAAKAFYAISYYDSTIAQYLRPAIEHLPDEMILGLKKVADLRYGENPHQNAALYSRSGARTWGLCAATVLHGKGFSYNHYLSMDRAAELVAEFDLPACAIVQHANPSGAACAERLADAARFAYKADPAGCLGGVAALNRKLDPETARALEPEPLECVLAPDFSEEALELLREKRSVRLVQVPSLLLSPNETDIKAISGGVLLQDKDNPSEALTLKAVTRRAHTTPELSALDFAWRVCKHATTYAAVLSRGTRTLGIAAGQVTVMDAVRLAVVKSQERHPVVSPDLPMVVASDGPLSPSHVAELAENGVTAIAQPGGSREDAEALQEADSLSMAMAYTGQRHYRH